MQGVNIAKKRVQPEFQAVAANNNGRTRIKITHKQQMLAAYGLGSKLNGWRDYTATFDEEFFCVRTYDAIGRPQRYIIVFRNPARDNGGYLFLVGAYGRQSDLKTNSLKYALGRFKRPDPDLRLVPTLRCSK